jgi:hypothetical protein
MMAMDNQGVIQEVNLANYVCCIYGLLLTL